MSERSPEALTNPRDTASLKLTRPIASSRQTSGAISTTAGGVPRVWAGPGMA